MMEIFEQIRNCDDQAAVKVVIKYITENPKCVGDLQDKQTPLHFAIAREEPDIAKALLTQKADPNAQDGYGRTPLWIAASIGDIQTVETLIEYKPKFAVSCCTCGLTVLHIAVQNRHHDVVRRLLETDKNLEVVDAEGETPLFKAARNDDLEMVEILTAHGALLTHSRKDGKTLRALADDGEFEDRVRERFGGKKAAPQIIVQTIEPVIKGNNKAVDKIDGHENNHGDEFGGNGILAALMKHVKQKKLEAFFGGNDERKLRECLRNYAAQVDTLSKGLKLEKELLSQLALLTLYDLAILIDDSPSMRSEDRGRRISALRRFIAAITHIYAYSCNGQNGKVLSIQFLNSDEGKDNVDSQAARRMLAVHEYAGVTRIGTELRKKILTPLVNEHMKRPLIVIIITDGEITGEREGVLVTALYNCIGEAKSFPGGEFSVTFQFCRVGDDPGAKKMLENLEKDQQLRGHIDCPQDDIDVEFDADGFKSGAVEKVARLMLGGISQIDGN